MKKELVKLDPTLRAIKIFDYHTSEDVIHIFQIDQALEILDLLSRQYSGMEFSIQEVGMHVVPSMDCEDCNTLKKRNEDLAAENAELKTQLRMMMESWNEDNDFNSSTIARLQGHLARAKGLK